MKETMRLDKYLSEMGQGTRSQIKEMARKGRITVNGATEKSCDRRVHLDVDKIALDGRDMVYAAYEYFMLNKPQGVVSATRDGLHETAVSLIKERKRRDLFPVGRLDIDTEGLLLLTNDGALAHRLLSPQKHVDKVYYAKVRGMLSESFAHRMKEGLILKDGTKTLPADLEIVSGNSLSAEGISIIRLTLREGKFHQVKRMFETLGCHVVYLKRLSMGGLFLDEQLKPGEYRALTREEVAALGKTGRDQEDDKRKDDKLED